MRRSLLLALSPLLVLAACGGEGKTENTAPEVSITGAADVVLGETVTLSAVATDAEGDALTYAWSLTTAPSGSALTVDATTAELGVTPDVLGDYTFTVTVSDGSLEASASASLAALPPPTIDGEFTVTVISAVDGAPIAGAFVEVSQGGPTATTDASGQATLTDASLSGQTTVSIGAPSLTVDVDHDFNAGTADIQRPAYRGVTLLGINRAAFTVPLKPTDSALQAAPKGVVRGTIDYSIFDRLPAIEPFLSFDMGATTSSQIRAVLIAPVVTGDPADFDVRDLLGRPPTLAAPLPGNLTTDDLFLNGSAALLGVPVTGDDPLMNFVVDAPVGQTRFFVLGVLVDIDALAVVPLLSGGGVDSAALFGSMAFTTLFVATLDLDVAAGDNDLAAPIADTDLTMVAEVPATITFADSTGPWALNPTTDVALRKAVVVPDTTATLTGPGLLADPRVAANLPTSTRVEIMDAQGNPQTPRQFVDLAVPGDTGAPTTDVPYSLAVAVVHDGAGMIPLGLTFTRVADLERGEAVFALPTFTGELANAPIEALVLTTRGMWPSAVDAGYELLSGLHSSRVPLTAGGTVAALAPRPFPVLDPVLDAGLRVRVQVERSDPSTTVVDSARAYLSFLENPPGSLVLSDFLGVSLDPSAAELSHATLANRTWIQVDDGQGGLNWTPRYDTLWDVYGPAGTLQGPLPDPAQTALVDAFLGNGNNEIRLRVRAESFASPLDLERWSGERLLEGPSEATADDFLFVLP
ncbi:MAG: hypothetical protein P1V51_08925 [Deltaproteobacteria bacterium]|nr:hypothetical protein [Deltaproteobacteria bacterium]